MANKKGSICDVHWPVPWFEAHWSQFFAEFDWFIVFMNHLDAYISRYGDIVLRMTWLITLPPAHTYGINIFLVWRRHLRCTIYHSLIWLAQYEHSERWGNAVNSKTTKDHWHTCTLHLKCLHQVRLLMTYICTIAVTFWPMILPYRWLRNLILTYYSYSAMQRTMLC